MKVLIGETEQATRVEQPVKVIVLAGCRVGIEHAQAAGHAEMEQGASCLRMHQQIFRAALNGFDALAGQRGDQEYRDRPAQFRLADDELRDALTEQMWRDATAGRFNFGQFGHGVIDSVRAGVNIAEQ